ncbi:hypothetical protein PG993_002193 [Apiospora rasikravindrae]|uniref:Uncharacterized protein n=1 Tax=Apiospora rasikravindrae TaxID=990691 RepID=A0ABR1UDM7_9PEZI
MVRQHPPETQLPVDAKPSEPALPPITKEPMATAQASMIPAPIDKSEADLTSAPTASTDAAKSPEDAKGGAAKETVAEAGLPAAQSDKPEALEDTNATTDGDSKEVPKPVSVEEVPDRELPDTKQLSAGSVTQPANEQQTAPPPAKKADSPAAEPAAGTVPKEDAQSTGPAQVLAETAKGEPQTGEKRKADDPAAHEESTNGDDASSANVDEKLEASPAKKQKTQDNETNGDNTGAKRGRPKKEKKPPAPVGRTARKTRSQAAAEL